jgi:ZIP family zinc transporter
LLGLVSHARFLLPAQELRAKARRGFGGALAFAAAALLYLVTEELLMEAHEGIKVETPVSTLVLFAGFLAFWAVQLAGRA